MLARLVYKSRAHAKLSMDLRDILASSQKNNPALGLTGALCFLDGVYLQYLEGEESNLMGLYKRIKSDPRHKDSVVLERSHITERAFPTWSMALVTWSDETQSIFREATGLRELDLYATDPIAAAPMFREFAASSNWLVV
ncbi:Sensor of blue light, FAD-binding domain [Burkholderiales bacterium 8X]|nr:Sensor of blue light, FAD-binding domain [Burkholderiales bacterium 8X]